jgi:hypothetical protein
MNMKSKWRERYQQEEWTQRVDISILYQLETEAANLQTRTAALQDENIKKAFQHLADRFTYLTAVASGKVANVDLAKEAMPEDAKAKIPDPRELRIRLRR